jgi:hypothetical protein
MKFLLAMVSMMLAAVVLEETVREIAGNAHGAVDRAVGQARDARHSMSETVGRQPWIALLIAGGVAYGLSLMVPTRT